MKKVNLLPVLLVAILFSFTVSLSAQKEDNEKTRRMAMHNEAPDDEYSPSGATRLTSPGKSSRSSVFFMTQVNVDESGYNILYDAANEPSIAIDPVNPDRMAIGWRQFDNVSNNFRQAGYAFTNDGGETWTFPGVINPGVFRSDPVLEADNQGVFYYNSLTSNGGNYFCRVFKSSNGGETWDEGAPAQGGDKQWMEIDKSGGAGEGNIYSFWTSYYSSCYPGNFTRSTNGGDFYEDCVSVDGDPYWGTMAIGSLGELYIVGSGYADGLVVAKSNNAQDPAAFVAWDYYSYVDLDGAMAVGAEVNPAGLLGQASIAVNQTLGAGFGDVYVLASVQRLSNYDPGDVMFAKSTNGGITFGEPVRINDDFSSSNTQWFGTMSVAPNGRIDVVWLDTRNAPSFSQSWSELCYSYSLDQGETWSENEMLSGLFDPHLGWPNQEKMGDYFDMVSDNSAAHLAWANTLNSEQDVYYSRITPLITGVSPTRDGNTILSFKASPSLFGEHTRLSYTLTKYSEVALTLCDIRGQEIVSLVNEARPAGSYTVSLDGSKLGLGMYFCRLTAGKMSKTIKLVRIE